MKRFRVIMASAASLDVVAIVSYVAAVDGVERAAAVDAKLDDKLRSLDRLAARGRVVPELRRRGIMAYREVVVPPYRIIYRLMRAEAWVVAVVDGRRDLDELLLDRTRRDV